MNKETIAEHLGFVLEETNFQDLGLKRKGKVRDVYDQGDKLVLIATDRYSAFDRNLTLIPLKGQALTAITAFWFDKTKQIVPNHVIGIPDPNVIIAKKCEVIPIEVVVRGYITGVTSTALWTKYQEGERDFGSFILPEGLKKNQKLERPVLTPTTKSDVHDRPITVKEIIEEGLVESKRWQQVEDVAFRLFEFGQKLALGKGLILVDTKYEFGIAPDGTLTLIDEIHTPDSSRYWQAGSYEERFEQALEPEYFDKEFLRLWFKEHCDPYKDKILPEAPKDKIAELAHRYVQICEQLTGEEFRIDFELNPEERIRKNLEKPGS